jgi:5-methylcytosine-specific restriction endonuclease McrA
MRKKHCHQCNRDKAVRAFQKVNGYYTSPCRACKNAAGRTQYRHNLEAERARSLAKQQRLKRDDPARLKRYQDNYRSRRRQKERERYAANLEQSRAKGRAKASRYRATHPKPRRRVPMDRESALAAHALNEHKRRAIKRAATIEPISRAWWQALKIAYGSRCAYCGVKRQRLEMDHIIPLARGGAHARDNIVPTCRRCNARKGVKPAPIFQPTLAGLA